TRGENMKSHQYLQLVEEKLQQLAKETDNVKKSEFFKKYLETMSKFWQYSYHNQLLIHLTKPDASKVAGFQTWKKLGRSVKKGSKAIRIVAPFTSKDKDEDKTFTYFVPVSVFDISQTDGEPLPDIDIALEGEDQGKLLDYLVEFCQAKDIKLDFTSLGINGVYGYSKGGEIKVSSEGSVNTKANTLVHEIAHELLHYTEEGKSLSKQQKEIQAEGTAYVVCKHFGLETKSFNYLALYDADYKKITGNLQAIAKVSKEILEFISFIC
ncbi:MAG: ImmA/IrrE family metallo-endopeptidase, partial [Nanoarchaeota archaeon]|nr:ImmA/IrrE family metallo-endopeptidase [Nanoarchaeota archaeon]